MVGLLQFGSMEVDTTIVDLMEAAKSFILCVASGQTRVLIFTKKKKRPKFHSLLPTSSNLFVHVIRAHLLVMLWHICDGILLLHYSALTQLSDERSCQCRAQEKMQQSWMRHISCSSYCNYFGEERCCNQYSKREEIQKGVEMQHLA